LNFRSDSGITPDPRTLATYSPAVNQPFYIGDGYNANNAFVNNSDSYVPLGSNQTFIIPAGASYLLLGIGADIQLSDNQNASNTNSAFVVHVFDDVGAGYATNASATTIYTAVEIDWQSQTNRFYQVQYVTSVNSNSWLNLGDPILGNGSTNRLFDSILGQPRKFYRVLTFN
jgi:hypothetical protein